MDPNNMDTNNIDSLCINTLRFLAADAVERAQSGHPGTAMGAAPIAYILWRDFLRHSPAHPGFVDRDRFVLSSGHASMLLYGLLHLCGYPVSIADLKAFRQWGSNTPGHPEYKRLPGIETTTGPLGQGFSNAVGMAMAEAHLAAKYNRPDAPKIVNHYTYVLASDGDIMEGLSAEAASLAGHLGLGKLIVFYDDNQVTIDGPTSLAFSEDVRKRFEAYGWHTQTVGDALALDEIRVAIRQAQEETGRPSIIAIRSVIGYGAPTKQGKSIAHAGPLGAEEIRKAKEILGWPWIEPFFVPQEVYQHFAPLKTAGENLVADWHTRFDKYAVAYPEATSQFIRSQKREFNPDWSTRQPNFAVSDGPIPTRLVNGPVVNALAREIPQLIGGSADLTPATVTYIEDSPPFSRDCYAGRNIHFGVREHAMGGVTNGLTLHGGLVAYAATFLIFADYMRPAMRMAALMGLPSIFVFTHDSIGLGEDGPTHQPTEQMMSLRLIPNMTVIRPCDANEVVQAWQIAVRNENGPTSILLTRQPLPVLPRNGRYQPPLVENGAYILSEAGDGSPQVILIASGSEIHPTLRAQQLLEQHGVSIRVVAMPSWELFARQPAEYRESVLPAVITARLAIEAGATSGWEKWVGDRGAILGIDRFGASAPQQVLFDKFGFGPENIVRVVMDRILGGN